MTHEEAIKNVTAYVYMECMNMPSQVIKALDIMKDATVKQIPKRPIVKDTNEETQKKLFYCSNCGEMLYAEHYTVGFCNCGQKIKIFTDLRCEDDI